MSFFRSLISKAVRWTISDGSCKPSTRRSIHTQFRFFCRIQRRRKKTTFPWHDVKRPFLEKPQKSKEFQKSWHLTHCSKSSFFVQKFNFDFPRKLSKNSWKCCGFGLFSCWQQFLSASYSCSRFYIFKNLVLLLSQFVKFLCYLTYFMLFSILYVI